MQGPFQLLLRRRPPRPTYKAHKVANNTRPPRPTPFPVASPKMVDRGERQKPRQSVLGLRLWPPFATKVAVRLSDKAFSRPRPLRPPIAQPLAVAARKEVPPPKYGDPGPQVRPEGPRVATKKFALLTLASAFSLDRFAPSVVRPDAESDPVATRARQTGPAVGPRLVSAAMLHKRTVEVSVRPYTGLDTARLKPA